MSDKDFGFGTQIRKSPYFDATVRWVKCKPMYVYSCLRRLSSKKYKKFAVNF